MSISKLIESRRQSPDGKGDAPQSDQSANASQYIGEMVYGGLDGIITTFAVVSGVTGGQLASSVIVILGLANLFADGFSMATGAYLSSRSEQEYYEREWHEERQEVEEATREKKSKLRDIYLEQGYSEQDAEQLVEIRSKDQRGLVRAMMVEDRKLMEDERNPLLTGLATFVAFVVAGSVPLLVYLLGLFMTIPAGLTFPIAVSLTALALFALGAAKVVIVKRSPFKSGLEMLLTGGLAAVVAYVVGALLKGIGSGG